MYLTTTWQRRLNDDDDVAGHDEPQGDQNYCFKGDADDDDNDEHIDIDCEGTIYVQYLLFTMIKLSVTERRRDGHKRWVIEMLRRI